MIKKRFCQTLMIVLSLVTIQFAYGQQGERIVTFIPHQNQIYGFDAYRVPEWRNEYHVQGVGDSTEYFVAHKSVVAGQTDTVSIISSYDPHDLIFYIKDSSYHLDYTRIGMDTFSVVLPIMESDYWMDVLKDDVLLGKIHVAVYEEFPIDVVVVPLLESNIDTEGLKSYLNAVYHQAGLSVSLSVEDRFKTTEFTDTILSNPSPDRDRYTDQMIDIRNEYFDEHPNRNKRAYYVFLVSGFNDDALTGYTVRNKAVSFVKIDADNLNREIARELGVAIGALEDTWIDDGPDKGTTQNLMDVEGTLLTRSQWEAIRMRYKMVSYYDEYEDVRTNNGIIAYYLWEEDQNGNIILAEGSLKKSIRRPFKRNTFSLHLDIDNFLFIPLFEVFGFDICLLHILSLLIFGFCSVYFRRKLFKRENIFTRYRMTRWGTRFAFFLAFLFSFYGTFLMINEGYYLFEVKEGKLQYLNGMSVHDAGLEIRENVNDRRSQEEKMGSEILIKRGNEWTMDRRKRVLYFDLSRDKNGKLRCKFANDSDSLILRTKDFKRHALSHYFVFNYVNEKGEYTKQRAFNHVGVEITDKLRLEDPAKRILLFVNGYRPTSLGKTFEENFADIRNNGLEFDDSKNLIYSFDRYSYWEPWNEINHLFELRLNPSESYYADGHHSVETSNHRSLIDFTTLSQTYPQRCKDPNHHVCKKSKKGWKILGMQRNVNTVKLHNLKPNRTGFETRLNNGRIAGRNLLQTFNELPNKSKNDTLYIVAHSMGYAYTLGILEQLRGKINFGGLYIIAPENASAGTINMSEWQEVWQYGSDFEAHRLDAPCLLDGIAPQTKVGGLSPRNRVYFPDELYSKQGFFNSHFIGNYTWIFDIPKDEIGHIGQR